MSETKFRTNYQPQVKVVAPVQPKGKPGRTKQSFKDECDINNIMKKFATKGILPEMIKRNPVYGDFSEPLDYQESCNLVLRADEQFQALPARVRERFQNSPAKFLEFAASPENALEMARMGLLTPEARERVLKASQPKIDPSGEPDGAQPAKKSKKAAEE